MPILQDHEAIVTVYHYDPEDLIAVFPASWTWTPVSNPESYTPGELVDLSRQAAWFRIDGAVLALMGSFDAMQVLCRACEDIGDRISGTIPGQATGTAFLVAVDVAFSQAAYLQRITRALRTGTSRQLVFDV